MLSGAGLSVGAPTSLPPGFTMRNLLINVLFAAADRTTVGVAKRSSRDEVIDSSRKMELVIGRMWGVAGSDALDCLLALRVEVPNESHLLAALHLMRGGTHLTLNFDVGIECAWNLLAGTAFLPDGCPEEFKASLEAWRKVAPATPGELRVVASDRDFDAWVREEYPPALLKLHGSLTREQSGLIDVVAVDIAELGQLSASRRLALESVSSVSRLVVTAYSGADPDIYQPLLRAAAAVPSSWHCLSLPVGSPVRNDLSSRNIELHEGEPEGAASWALRDLLGDSLPTWPKLDLGASQAFSARFDAWTELLRRRHTDTELAQAWAWLLADIGELDESVDIYRALRSDASRSTWDLDLRLAEVLYTRASGDDRALALDLFRSVRGSAAADNDSRFHCLLREADVARGLGIRGSFGPAAVRALFTAYVYPIRVLISTGGGKRNPDAAADAYRALQQTSLRILERLIGVAPKSCWPPLGLACRVVSHLGVPAERLARNGNRRVLIRQQRLLLLVLADLVRHTRDSTEYARELEELRTSYLNADDLPGAANCIVGIALHDIAEGNSERCHSLLAEAKRLYGHERQSGGPLVSGQAMLAAASKIIARIPPA